MANESSIQCPVCGFVGLRDRPYDDFGCPTYTICPCCGTEFGYDDATAAHKELRRKWIEKGMPWWSTHSGPPMGWDPRRQLQDAHMTDS
jgi:hypothetical protein